MLRHWQETLGCHKYQMIGSFVIAAAVLINYYPSVPIGFLGDDWWFLGKAASLNLAEYIRFYFDPAGQIFWYRPIYGVWLYVEYLLFGSNAAGYHWGQIALHLVNCLLLFAVIGLVWKRWRIAWLASLIYAVLPVYASAVFWIAVQDPLAMVFFLAAMLFWTRYLQSNQSRYYLFTVSTVVLALLGKETSFFLPIALFLLERWFVFRPMSRRELIRTYSPFALIFLAYLLLEKYVQATAYFPNHWGYGLSLQIVENGLHYLAQLVFPWGIESPVSYLLLALVLILSVIIGLQWRRRLMLFLGTMVVLTIAPAVPFPTTFFYPRYLYAAAIVSAVLMALFFEFVSTRGFHRRGMQVAVSACVCALVLVGATRTSAMADWQAEQGREFRVPLRDIYQQHPAYPPGTYLYFVEPPYPMIMRNLSGMFLMRYGTSVTVWSNDAEFGGVDEDRFADLRDHKSAFVYYFDESKRHHEIPVDLASRATASPVLPVRLQQGIRLEGFEVTSTTLQPGHDLALLLYWRTMEKLDKDYTVFVHLVNEKGETVFGQDTQPRGGRVPTTNWEVNKLVADVHILTIPPDLSPGKYHFEVGLYYLPTQRRLEVVDDQGRVVTDHVGIESFTVAR